MTAYAAFQIPTEWSLKMEGKSELKELKNVKSRDNTKKAAR